MGTTYYMFLDSTLHGSTLLSKVHSVLWYKLPDPAIQSLSGTSYLAAVATAHKLVYYITRSEQG